ncbi:MAG: pilus assembly protein PilP [Pseudazoarcus pumilus]|nr:pilus assembly protein PilP [Pseudazoarcus pumilus]
MSTVRVMLVALSIVLAGCADEGDDLRAWMEQEASTMVGRIPPLPEIKPFPVIGYEQADKVDPFATSRIQPEARAGAQGGPDMNRPREPLESFPLESMNMVGTLMQNDRKHALITVAGRIHQVVVGNYMGQDHGMVTRITESEVTLNEVVEDMNGDWVERTSRLLLQER